jgi:hypothetical protein
MSDWYTLPVNFSRMDSRGSTLGLRPEITSKLALIQEAFQQHAGKPDYRITITAGQEWNPKHGRYSLHHTGFAVVRRGYTHKRSARRRKWASGA